MTNIVTFQTKSSLSSQGSSRKRLPGNVVIGKDILELVSGAMYVEPLTIIREYVQNAVDSIDAAERAGLYTGRVQPRIEIAIDVNERTLRIRDTGIGVENKDFARRLTAFGASKKRGTQARGFRGVGRLSGLGYCQEMVFRSKSTNDSQVMEISWDGRKFKEILLNPKYKGDLNDVVRDVTTLTVRPNTGYPNHFFEVELRQPTRQRNDVLLNEHEIEMYLAQIAPVPFHPDFKLGKDITRYLTKYDIWGAYNIQITSTSQTGGTSRTVYRPYRNGFTVFGGNSDRFDGVTFFEFPGINGSLAAVGWALDHRYYGAIPKNEGIRGLRLRSGNIQIGSDDIVADAFPEPRFNSWMVGEIHTVMPTLTPNGRRDAFESNVHYVDLHGRISAYAKGITKTCREKSKARNAERRFDIERNKIEEILTVIARHATPRVIKDRLRKELTVRIKMLERLVHPISCPRAKGRHQSVLTKLKMRAGKNLDQIALSDPLARLPRNKQRIYRQVISLVFECAPNHKVGGAMVERMLARLMK